ncbi:helix-turn-helix domain-containing protein [Actinomadura montaniterrae]|uniref:Helix-turn-helix domain-containing protein n=1 Tax=Actinomadura montaniterrae TaxID=1803903 RepID=A0A6L3VUJ0_9ACTN|nr:helix-turn-helix transcriptional regulator [Actinomadura montaniterrae]KAB2376979.1 helix-turn-helix domain-containing protein [Actinomadura montaniterrae]
MPINPSPDPRSSMWAWIAHDLRLYRERRGQSGQAVARLLNVGRSSISRLENDQARLTEDQAVILDKAWDTGGHFTLMVWYASKGHDPEWFRQHVEIERRARVIKIWDLAWIPGLFQTQDYARASLLAGRLAGGFSDITDLLEARLLRQQILHQDEPPVLLVLIWEPLLAVPVGGPEVMRDQLRHLLEVSHLPNTSVRVVPTAAGAHIGLDGCFKIMTSGGSDVAYVEAPGGGRLVPTSAEVLSYAIWWDTIGQEALPAGASRELVTRYMEGMQ